MINVQLKITILFVIGSLLSGCTAHVKAQAQKDYRGSWTILEEGCDQNAEGYYHCTQECLEQSYDNLVDCSFDLRSCRADVDLCEQDCLYKLDECNLDLQAWWRNPLIVGGGGFLLGFFTTLAMVIG